MSLFSKIVKNLALAFGIFLAISIISFGLDLAYFFFESTNLVKNNSYEISGLDFQKYSTYLDVDLKASNLIIKKGDNFGYQTNIKDLKVTQDNDKLVIKDNRKNIFNNKNNDVTLYIPADLLFERVNIEMGAGKLDVEQVELNNVRLDLGVGKVIINSKLTGKNTIECGIGEVDLNLNLPLDSYKLKLEKGIGEITLNGKKVKDDASIGKGINTVNVEGGIGKIAITTKEDR